MQDERRPRRGPRRSLSTERIVATALELLDDPDGGPVSVRAVAARLGVRPNTLYTYFPDGDALAGAVVDTLLDRAGLALLDGPAAPARRIEHYAVSLRKVLLDRPAAVPLFHSAPMDGPHAAIFGERLLELLVEAGHRPAEASRLSYLLIVYVLGAVSLAVAETGRRRLTDAERVALRAERFAAADPDAMPLSAATAGIAATWDGEDQFRWGLRRILG